MNVYFSRTEAWRAAQAIALGKNIDQRGVVAVDPSVLSEESRGVIVRHHGSYPDSLYAVTTGGDLAADLHSTQVSPADVDTMIADALRREEQRQAAKEAALVEAARVKAEEEAQRVAAARAYLADESARPVVMDSSPRRHWIELAAGHRISCSHPLWPDVDAATARRLDADELERTRPEREAQAQIADWVRDHGTQSQKDRLAEGLLPTTEVLGDIRLEMLAPGAGLKLYTRITDADLCADCPESDQWAERLTGDYEVKEATALSGHQYDTLIEIREAFPGAEVTPRRHTGTIDCGNDGHDHTIVRYGAKVHICRGAIHVTAEYAL